MSIEEKLQKYIDWQTSRVKSKIRTDIGQEAYLSLLKLQELGLAKIEPATNNQKPTKEVKLE